MALFVGGPYDSHDIPVDASVIRVIDLPAPEHFDEYTFDVEATGDTDWPHRYERDDTSEPPVFRFVG